ncbi:hypothetical protein [Rhodopila sp.]|jgi:hypothetical protein|uniref:hypothetical protein n=1 Tax=Rhodopila sp. TaxID=2480087 RepID=UPI002C1D8C97|nr:hypothetical protein [Rhodopila sp.]HVZ09422.1 hypothetical protein [Rhodopila sp.]
MLTLLAAAGLLLDLTIRAMATCKRHLVQPILTSLLLTVAYAVVHIGAEGSISGGLAAAFWESDAAREARHRASMVDTLQGELRQFVAANKLIDQHLQTILAKSDAARVRLAVIHNGVMGLTGTGLLRYDITNSMAAPGRATGDPLRNQPLADWADFLQEILADQCVMAQVAELRSVSLRAQFDAVGASSVLVCPSPDIQGRVVGAVFLFWDRGDAPPKGEALRRLMTFAHGVAGQIATVLSLRSGPPCDDRPPSRPVGR